MVVHVRKHRGSKAMQCRGRTAGDDRRNGFSGRRVDESPAGEDPPGIEPPPRCEWREFCDFLLTFQEVGTGKCTPRDSLREAATEEEKNIECLLCFFSHLRAGDEKQHKSLLSGGHISWRDLPGPVLECCYLHAEFLVGLFRRAKHIWPRREKGVAADALANAFEAGETFAQIINIGLELSHVKAALSRMAPALAKRKKVQSLIENVRQAWADRRARFPSESEPTAKQQIANQFNVNKKTIQRAVAKMAIQDWTERRSQFPAESQSAAKRQVASALGISMKTLDRAIEKKPATVSSPTAKKKSR